MPEQNVILITGGSSGFGNLADILDRHAHLDVVVHNAGHTVLAPAEAFTAEQPAYQPQYGKLRDGTAQALTDTFPADRATDEINRGEDHAVRQLQGPGRHDRAGAEEADHRPHHRPVRRNLR